MQEINHLAQGYVCTHSLTTICPLCLSKQRYQTWGTLTEGGIMPEPSDQDLSIGRAQTMRTLAKLRKRLIINSSDCLSDESAELYEHIEKTLLMVLGEHYGRTEKEHRG